MLLIDALPLRHQTCPETAQIQQALQGMSDELADRYDTMIAQLNASTVSEWMDLWEKAYGILPDVAKDLEYRRTRLVSRMRGYGTTTHEMIRTVSGSYVNGEVAVTENNPGYSFTVKFISTKGIPPNLDDLKAAIEEIKPAHLAVEYQFSYLIWREIDAAGIIFPELDQKNLTWIEFERGEWIE